MEFNKNDRVICQLNGFEGEVLGPAVRPGSYLVFFPSRLDCAVIRERFLRPVEPSAQPVAPA